MQYTHPINRAVRFAIKTHEIYQKQKRKGKDIPYITHPLTVGLILARARASEDVIVAGILHDTIEDSVPEKKVTYDMLAERFGEHVTELVYGVTETNKELSWEERKAEALEHIKTFSHNLLLLKSADIISNTTELIEDYEQDGEAVFERFNAPKDKILHHALHAIYAIIERWSDSPLVEDLRDLARKVQALGDDEFMLRYPAKIVPYYSYDGAMSVQCSVCGWEGVASDTSQENYRELFDVSCPRCDKMLLIVPFPTADETKQEAALGNSRAQDNLLGVLATEMYAKAFSEQCLKSPEQLPDFDGDRLEFLWDFEELPTNTLFDTETVLRHNDRILWREPAIWEGLSRFNAVKDLLKQKYGSRFHSLTPTSASELFLYGDDLSAHRNISFN